MSLVLLSLKDCGGGYQVRIVVCFDVVIIWWRENVFDWWFVMMMNWMLRELLRKFRADKKKRKLFPGRPVASPPRKAPKASFFTFCTREIEAPAVACSWRNTVTRNSWSMHMHMQIWSSFFYIIAFCINFQLEFTCRSLFHTAAVHFPVDGRWHQHRCLEIRTFSVSL